MISSAGIEAKIERSRAVVRAGYAKMAQQEAVICGTVRDCAGGLRRNIPVINRLANSFDPATIIIVENDSVDETKDLLRNWSESQDGVQLISTDTGIKTIQQKSDGVNPWFSEHRISLMAKYRNQYLEHINSSALTPGYVVVVDLDVVRISLDGIAYGFGLDAQWDGLCANGMKRGESGWIYYDTYAYQAYGDNGAQDSRELLANQQSLARMAAGDEPVRVNSAFGGLAVYSYEAVKNCRYACLSNNDPVITAHSEHIAFHRQMAQQGFDKIYINPAQIVVY